MSSINHQTEQKYVSYYAGKADRLTLESFYSNTSTDGLINFCLERKPDFFQALEVEGDKNHVIILKDTRFDKIVASCIFSTKTCFINKKKSTFGYISSFRISEEYRNKSVLRSFIRMLDKTHSDMNCSFYLVSIFRDNQHAQRTLIPGKAGMGKLKSIGRFHTLLFKSDAIKESGRDSRIVLKRGDLQNIEDLLSFFRRKGRNLQFFPYYNYQHLTKQTGLLRNLKLEDIWLAYRGNKLVGCMALWDQTGFRNWKISNYALPIKLTRPFINALSFIQNKPSLVQAGKSVPYKVLSLICVENHDFDIFYAILSDILKNIKEESELIALGLKETDTWLKKIKFPHISFISNLYLAYWSTNESLVDQLNLSDIYIETGSL